MKHKHHLDIAPWEQLRAALRAAVPSSAQTSLSDTGETSRPSDENREADYHLTDAEFFGLSLDQLTTEERGAAEEHLAGCPACSAEWERIESLSALWDEPAEVLRLESRRRERDIPVRPPLLQRLAAGMLTSLRALVPPQEAFAQGAEAEEADIAFVIVDGQAVIQNLNGILKRKNREYYARIIADSEDARQFSDRSVFITIQDGEGEPLLQRRLDVGVGVLLGTDLPLTVDSLIEARLMPLSSLPLTGQE